MRIEELLHAAMVRKAVETCATLGVYNNDAPAGANQPGHLDQETCIGGIPMSTDGTPTTDVATIGEAI